MKVFAVALASLLVVACDSAVSPTSDMTPQFLIGGSPLQIGFATDRDGNFEIYAMTADGSGPINLTNDPGPDVAPTWAPDGRRLAFATIRGGANWEVYAMNADGSGLINLTNDPGFDASPAWSPDGDRIAFVSARAAGPSASSSHSDIYVMEANGTGVTLLTRTTAFDGAPTWAPDASQIAFVSDRDGDMEVHVMNADGTGVANLSRYPGAYDGEPNWSPDGTRIAFASARDGDQEIYVMNRDGSGVKRLTWSPGIDEYPAWLADGRITFTSFRDGSPDVFVMHADGSGQTNITNHPAADLKPTGLP